MGGGLGEVLAVDIGGTKMAVGVVDGDGALRDRRQIPTMPEDPWPGLRDLLASMDHHAVACGIGCGGPMDADTVSPLNIPGWRGFPLKRRIAEVTGLATFVDNDAKALALGEGWTGAAAGERNFIAMVVSTGVGGGIVLDGRLLDGRAGNAGHIGHIIVSPDGPPCVCGARGCLEAIASGPSIERATGRPAKDASDEVKIRTGRMVGRAVADVANLLDLRLAVVAGSVAVGFGATFLRSAQEEIDARARIEFAAGCRIVPAVNDPLVGAAAVAWRHGRQLSA